MKFSASNLAVLMPTAPQYLGLAQWTCGRIPRFWPAHPPIYFCGALGDVRSLRLRDDPQDWMRVVASACADLLSDGFRQVYLVLDDHPPISECNADFLGGVLPRMLQTTDATSCLAVGPGPVLKRKGSFQKIDKFFFEKLPLNEPWKLPLHPALWNLEKLYAILEHLIRHLPDSQHHPWAFERLGSSPKESGLCKEWLDGCWRVDGMRAATPEAKGLHNWRDVAERLILRASSIALRSVGGPVEIYKSRIAFLWHPRIGAYPCFWSGVMKKGRLNIDYLTYASFKNRADLIEGLHETFVGIAP